MQQMEIRRVTPSAAMIDRYIYLSIYLYIYLSIYLSSAAPARPRRRSFVFTLAASRRAGSAAAELARSG